MMQSFDIHSLIHSSGHTGENIKVDVHDQTKAPGFVNTIAGPSTLAKPGGKGEVQPFHHLLVQKRIGLFG